MTLGVILLVIMASITFAQELSVEEEWNKFKADHNKVYPTAEEEQHRFNIFVENLKSIREHNKRFRAGEVSWDMGLNQFSDLTSEEFVNLHTGLRIPDKEAEEVA